MESNIQATEVTAPVTETPVEGQAVETPTTETAAPEQVTEEKKAMLSPQLAALAKKEKALVRREQEAKSLLAQMQKEREEFQKEREALQELKKNPWKLLEQAGYSYEDLTNMKLNEGNPTPDIEIKNVKSEIQKLREEQELERKKIKEEQERMAKENEAKQIQIFKDNLQKTVKAQADKFELVNLYGAYETVFQTIETHFEETQEVMDIETAAELVEKYFEGEVEKVLKAKKVATKIAPPKEEKPQTVSKTLSNQAATSTAPSSLPPRNEQDRIARALAALNQA